MQIQRKKNIAWGGLKNFVILDNMSVMELQKVVPQSIKTEKTQPISSHLDLTLGQSPMYTVNVVM